MKHSLHRSFLTAALTMLAVSASANWYDFALVSMTTPTSAKLINRYLCYTDGANIACDSPSLFLSTGGLVGIGTTKPNAKLDVYGTVSATNFVGDGSGLTNLSVSGDRIVSDSTRVIAHRDASITFSTAGAQRMIVGVDGKVGIGNNAPVANLHVVGLIRSVRDDVWGNFDAYQYSDTRTAELVLRRARGTSESPTYPLENDSLGAVSFRNHVKSAGAEVRSFATETHTSSVAGADLVFRTIANGTGSLVSRMRIADDGKVGIGNFTPMANLDVAGTISATDAIQVGTSSLTCGAPIAGAIRYHAGTLQVCNGSAWASVAGGASGIEDRIVSGSTSVVAYKDSSITFSTAATQRMLLSAAGSLGLGTMTPEMRLHISTPNPAIRLTDTDTGASHDIDGNSSFGALFVDVDRSNVFPNSSLIFRNAGANLVTISKTGHVGIGEVHPTARLVVRNTGSINGTNTHQAIFQDDSNDGLNGGLFISSFAPRLTFNDRSTDGLWFDWRADGDYFRLGSGVTTDAFARVTDSIVIVNRTGNVGVGTVGSVARFYVQAFDDQDAIAYFTGGSSQTKRIVVNNNGGDAQLSFMNTGNSRWTMGNQGSSDNFFIRNGAGPFGTGADRLSIISSTGNVGIGTANPQAKLDIWGGIMLATDISSRKGQGQFYASNLYYDGGWKYASNNNGAYLIRNSGDGIQFFTAPGGASEGAAATVTEHLRIANTGKIGVGRTTPLGTFDVLGTISASDAIQVGTSSLACGAGIAGALRYNAGNIQVCNGAAWSSVGGGSAMGDRITSGTLSVIANTNNYVSLTTGSTTWGYFNNSNSYLPKLATAHLTLWGTSGADGGIYINTTTSRTLSFGNVGVGAPTAGSAGMKIQLYGSNPGVMATNNYAIGVEGNNMWFNTGGTGTNGFKWYATGVERMKLDASGNLTATAYLHSSDARLKNNIHAITGGLAKLDAINPVSFSFNSDTTGRTHLGVLAQDVEKVFPELVLADDNGMKKVDYPGLIAPLIAAVKELKAANDNLQSSNSRLTEELSAERKARQALEADLRKQLHDLGKAVNGMRQE